LSGSKIKIDHFIKPMLAKETDAAFDNNDWLFEIKWDGYRAVAELKNSNVKLYSRNGLSFEQHYPVVFAALKKIKLNAVLDGEIVVLNEKGLPDFQKLQHYDENNTFPICYYIFDLLAVNGKDITALTLIERKKMLKTIIKKNTVIKYSDHLVGKGISFFNATSKQGLEGIMAKNAGSQYDKGSRTSDWLKIKHHRSEEVIIAGFTQPAGARKYFGALVLAVKDKQGLKYAGHTGSGFNNRSLKEIYDKLKRITTTRYPFNEVVKTNNPVTWVKTKYVCEIKFTEWTNDGKMRHPIFLRMREDKSTTEIVMKKKVTAAASKKKPLAKTADTNEQTVTIGTAKVNLSNQNKIYWPAEKITKGMVVEYYQSIAPYILPYLKDRPESLKRNPNGITDKGFYHKDAGTEAPRFVKSLALYSKSAKKDIDYIICNNKATLAYLNNLGCIELNPWHSTVKALDKPDYLIIDIDPSAKNNFEQVIQTALAFKTILDKAGAKSFCKTSGATGLHIYVPMGKKYLYDQVRSFAEILCQLVNEQLPKFTTMERNLKKRGNNKIYLDHLQNSRGQTIASAYSLRPHKGATVSTPLLWKEVKTGLHPSAFNIHTVPARLKKMKDLFAGVLGKGTDIDKCLSKLQ
jgi:bifunctional non-homologous end joining protein LigD